MIPVIRKDQEGSLSQMKERVESHSHNLILDERIDKLQHEPRTGTSGFRLIPFVITASVIIATGYLVV